MHSFDILGISSSDEEVDVKFLNVTVEDQMLNINNGKVVTSRQDRNLVM